jgi:hypothetical protein
MTSEPAIQSACRKPALHKECGHADGTLAAIAYPALGSPASILEGSEALHFPMHWLAFTDCMGILNFWQICLEACITAVETWGNCVVT